MCDQLPAFPLKQFLQHCLRMKKRSGFSNDIFWSSRSSFVLSVTVKSFHNFPSMLSLNTQFLSVVSLFLNSGLKTFSIYLSLHFVYSLHYTGLATESGLSGIKKRSWQFHFNVSKCSKIISLLVLPQRAASPDAFPAVMPTSLFKRQGSHLLMSFQLWALGKRLLNNQNPKPGLPTAWTNKWHSYQVVPWLSIKPLFVASSTPW